MIGALIITGIVGARGHASKLPHEHKRDIHTALSFTVKLNQDLTASFSVKNITKTKLLVAKCIYQSGLCFYSTGQAMNRVIVDYMNHGDMILSPGATSESQMALQTFCDDYKDGSFFMRFYYVQRNEFNESTHVHSALLSGKLMTRRVLVRKVNGKVVSASFVNGS